MTERFVFVFQEPVELPQEMRPSTAAQWFLDEVNETDRASLQPGQYRVTIEMLVTPVESSSGPD